MVPTGVDAVNNSAGIITFLTGEKVWMDNPGTLYGYTLDRAANGFNANEMYFKVATWLNKNFFDIKTNLKNLPTGITGFASKNGNNGFTAVLWNTSDTNYQNPFSNLSYPISDM